MKHIGLILLAGICLWVPACNTDKHDQNSDIETPTKISVDEATSSNEDEQLTDNREIQSTLPIETRNTDKRIGRVDPLRPPETHIVLNNPIGAVEVSSFIPVHPSIDAKNYDALIITAEGEDVCMTKAVNSEDLNLDNYMVFNNAPGLIKAPKDSLFCDYLKPAMFCEIQTTEPIYFLSPNKQISFTAKDLTDNPHLHFSDVDAICRQTVRRPLQ